MVENTPVLGFKRNRGSRLGVSNVHQAHRLVHARPRPQAPALGLGLAARAPRLLHRHALRLLVALAALLSGQCGLARLLT